jgi:hypothetical protein
MSNQNVEQLSAPVSANDEQKGALSSIIDYFTPSVKVNGASNPGVDIGAGPFEAGAHLGSLSAYSRAGPFGGEASAAQMRMKANAGDNGFYAGWTKNGPTIGIYSSLLGMECPDEFKQPINHAGKGEGVDLVEKCIEAGADLVEKGLDVVKGKN